MLRFVCFWLLVLPLENHAQDTRTLLNQAGQLEKLCRESDALLVYGEVIRIQPTNITALCRCSELSCLIGNRQSARTSQTVYFEAARTYAEAALRINPQVSESNFVMAFALGRLCLISSGRERIRLAQGIKRYTDLAIAEDPRNFKAYHLLGKWNYEVSNLNFMERTLARWMYGALPPASLQSAIAAYEKCLQLSPEFLLNYLELARAYDRNGQRRKAQALLSQMLRLPNASPDDNRIKSLGKELLLQWQ
jgi:hypothetical protein